MVLTKSPKSETLNSVKPARFHPAIRLVLREFPEDIRVEIGKAIFELQKGMKVFYLTVADDGVYIFQAFKKTTRATPNREIELGRKRLREML